MKILVLYVLYGIALCANATCPVRINLDARRIIESDDFGQMCVTLDTADICYTGEFTRSLNWKLSIMIVEQATEGKETLPDFPDNATVQVKNTCASIKKPMFCFAGHNPFVESEDIKWNFISDFIYFKRIKTSSSFLRRIERYWSPQYGARYANVQTKICLSFQSSFFDTDKKWFSRFQFTRGTESPMSRTSSNDRKKHCFTVKNQPMVIFSEHPEDVTLWQLNEPLYFSAEKNQSQSNMKYIDQNSRNITNENECHEEIAVKICITNPESSSSEDYVSTINLNIGTSKEVPKGPLTGCLNGSISKICIPKNIPVNNKSLWIMNTLYFVTSANTNKFFCNKFKKADVCFNEGAIESSIQFHSSSSLKAPLGGQCLETCEFETCFTENEKGLPWKLISTMYFTKTDV